MLEGLPAPATMKSNLRDVSSSMSGEADVWLGAAGSEVEVADSVFAEGTINALPEEEAEPPVSVDVAIALATDDPDAAAARDAGVTTERRPPTVEETSRASAVEKRTRRVHSRRGIFRRMTATAEV